MPYAAVLNNLHGKVQFIEYNDEVLEPHNGDVEDWLIENHQYSPSNMDWMAINKIEIEVINLETE